MAWTLNGTELASLAHGEATLSFRSQAVSDLQIRKPGVCDEAEIASGTWCTLVDPEGNTVFQGEAVLVQGEASGQAEQNVTRIVDPWNDLERIGWRDGDNLRLNFPADPDSTAPVLLQDAIASVLADAISLGARFTIGTIDVAGQIPAAQFDNTTCAAILIALLRWSPGAVTEFDHDTGGLPAINVIAAANLPDLDLPIEGCGGLQVTPRTDCRVPGVKLVYRKKIQSSYGEAEGTSTDSAGTPSQRGALVMALDLNPARVEYSLQSNRVKVAAQDLESGDWWRTFGCTSVGDPDFSTSTGDTDLGYYVTAGQIQNWMLNTINGEANAEPHGCNGPLAESPAESPSPADAFSPSPPALHIANDQSFKLGRRRFTAHFPDGKSWVLDLPVTDLATSGTYYREIRTAWDPGEEVPTGLAAALYAAASLLAYSGRFGIQQDECTPPAHGLGHAVNITGTEWGAIRSPIYSVQHDIALGKTVIDFGPSALLGAADLLELYRAMRAKKAERPPLSPEEEPAPVNYSAVAQAASNEQPDEETGSLVVNCEDEDGAAFPDGAFVVGGRFGKSGESIELPVGSYEVAFLPVFGRKTPNNISGTISEGVTETREATYYYQEEIYLEDQTDPNNWAHLKALSGDVSLTLARGGNTISIDAAAGITISNADGRFITLSMEAWLQQMGADSKQIYSDPADVPESGNAKVLGGTDGFASIQIETDDDCEEGE